MGNLKKKLKTVQGTSTAPNQSTTSPDTVESLVDKFDSSSSTDNRDETNTDYENYYRHIESLVVRILENPSSSTMLQHKEMIRERDNEINKLKLIIDSYKQELLSKENRIQQLITENYNLKDKNIAVCATQNNENDIVINEYQRTIDDSVSQPNNSNENDFNDDCLLEIFSYLSLDDMMQAKKVCKKWYRVSQQIFKQVQTLVYREGYFGHNTLELCKKYYGRKIYEKFGIHGLINVISILNSCGNYIRYYEVKRKYEKYDDFIFQLIPKLCKNIVDININASDYTSLNFETMATNWEKLEKIEIRNLPKSFDEDFLELLRNNEQLKTVSIEFAYDDDEEEESPMDDDFFTYLPTTIEKISLGNISIDYTEELSHFISASKKFTSLKSLKLSGFNCLTDAILAAIVNIKSLIHLHLHVVSDFESRTTINQIAKMKDLKSLVLIDINGIHEDNIINIVQSCTQLESLRIKIMNLITDRGLGAIVKLKKLKCLDINMTNVTDKTMINLCDKLEILNCSRWKINKSDVIEMFKKLTNLKYVNFVRCKNLTEEIIQAANEIANERKKNVLYINTNVCCCAVDNIDTPYFKHFTYTAKIPREIIPDYMRDDMKEILR